MAGNFCVHSTAGKLELHDLKKKIIIINKFQANFGFCVDNNMKITLEMLDKVYLTPVSKALNIMLSDIKQYCPIHGKILCSCFAVSDASGLHLSWRHQTLNGDHFGQAALPNLCRQ